MKTRRGRLRVIARVVDKFFPPQCQSLGLSVGWHAGSLDGMHAKADPGKQTPTDAIGQQL